MAATGQFAASLSLALPAPGGTSNEVQQRLSADGSVAAVTNTIAQIAFFVTDGITGDDQTVELRLMQPEQAVTVDTGTNKIGLAAHGFSAGQPGQFTGTLPAPLAAGVIYYVRDPGANDFKLAETVGGPAIDLTTAGSGVKFRPFGAVSLSYPYHQPGVPVQVREQFTGEVNDFTKVRAVQVIFRPLDVANNASGNAQLTMGDTGERYGHFSVPLQLSFTAGGEEIWPSWIGILSQGLSYDTDWHLTLRIKSGESNVNGLVLINLLGN